MRTLLLVFVSIISFSVNGISEIINPNTEYIWARSGLNVRSGPGTKYKVIEKLVFGDSLTIISETDVKYNMSGISNVDTTQHYFTRYEKKGAFVLYGKWVEIYTPGGKFGYVIDHYLSNVPPNIMNEERVFNEISRDTISIFGVDDSYETSISLIFENGITGGTSVTQGCYEESYILPGYTIQEAFVMLIQNTDVRLKVTKNWPNELSLSDGGMYSHSFILKEGVVYYSFEACC